jgi:hypothetical protein
MTQDLPARNRRPVIRRIADLLRRPRGERRRAVGLFVQALVRRVLLARPVFLNMSISCMPDAQVRFQAYPEFEELLRRFVAHNRRSNSGDISRLWFFILNIRQIIEENIAGNFAELGVWRGNTASVLAHFAARNDRQVYLFDTFEGFDSSDLKGVDSDRNAGSFGDTSVDLAKAVIGRNSECCHFVKGHFPASLQEPHKQQTYCVVSLDCDLYEPMQAGLRFFYPLMPRGGIFLLHDYSSKLWAGAKSAIDEFCRETGEFVVLMPDKSGSAVLRKNNQLNR